MDFIDKDSNTGASQIYLRALPQMSFIRKTEAECQI